MSVSLKPVITIAGLEAVLNATNDGLQARITHVALGDAGWTPDNTAIRMNHEKNRVPVANGTRVNPTQIHITAVEDGSTQYWVREIGFFLDDGTLLAIWSDPDVELAWKAEGVDLLLAFDMVLTALPPDSVTIESSGLLDLSPATPTKKGVVRLATVDEAKDGIIGDAVVMTPQLCTIHGDERYSGSAHSHNWDEINSKPVSFPPQSHDHFWDEIRNKPPHFPPSEHDHDRVYMRRTGFRVTSGFVATNNRYSKPGWAGFNDWTRNYADIHPPTGYSMGNLMGFIASIGVIYFAGGVGGNDNLWLRWRRERNNVRVICNNSENRHKSYINYLAIWRKY